MRRVERMPHEPNDADRRAVSVQLARQQREEYLEERRELLYERVLTGVLILVASGAAVFIYTLFA